MSDYTIEELENFLDEVNSRIADVEAKMEELEDIMNSGDEQIALQERHERLIGKAMSINDAINEIKDREFAASGVDFEDFDDDIE